MPEQQGKGLGKVRRSHVQDESKSKEINLPVGVTEAVME